jgi:hypothetical protein
MPLTPGAYELRWIKDGNPYAVLAKSSVITNSVIPAGRAPTDVLSAILSITQPPGGIRFAAGKTANNAAKATDNVAVTTMEILSQRQPPHVLEGQRFAEVRSERAPMDAVGKGYGIEARAEDAAGNRGSVSMTLNSGIAVK